MIGTMMAGNVLFVIIPGHWELIRAKQRRARARSRARRQGQAALGPQQLPDAARGAADAQQPLPVRLRARRRLARRCARSSCSAPTCATSSTCGTRGRTLWSIPVVSALAVIGLAIWLAPPDATPSAPAERRRCRGRQAGLPDRRVQQLPHARRCRRDRARRARPRRREALARARDQPRDATARASCRRSPASSRSSRSSRSPTTCRRAPAPEPQNRFACSALLARDLVLVGAHQVPAAHDRGAADVEPVDAVRAREHEAGDAVAARRQLEAVRAPDRDVGALARLERADVVAPEHGRAAARAEAQRLARRHAPAARRGRARRAAPA